MRSKLFIGLGIIFTIGFASCGDNDVMNGAIAHGKIIGERQCECSKAEPQDAGKCLEELLFEQGNYKAFLETAKEEGSDMAEINAAYQKEYDKATAACK